MALHGIGYAILPSVTLQNEDKVNKMPLLDMKGHPIGRDTWLLGYEPAFELKQVQAFASLSLKWIFLVQHILYHLYKSLNLFQFKGRLIA